MRISFTAGDVSVLALLRNFSASAAANVSMPVASSSRVAGSGGDDSDGEFDGNVPDSN
jgi:hypothetical protein